MISNPQSSMLSGRWDSNPRPSPWQGDVLPLYYARRFSAIISAESAETQDRTGDTAIFSRVLYQLSYLGLCIFLLSVRDFTRTYTDCQEKCCMYIQYNSCIVFFLTFYIHFDIMLGRCPSGTVKIVS